MKADVQMQSWTPLSLVSVHVHEQKEATHHPGHVFGDRFNGLHGVDGDGVGLFHSQLMPEALLQLSHAKV